MKKRERKSIMHWYLQYSKRIAIFGIVQWMIVAVTALTFIWVVSLIDNYLTEAMTSIANTVITSSSALAISTSAGYFAHSAYDKKLKEKVEKTIFGEDSEEEIDEEAGQG